MRLLTTRAHTIWAKPYQWIKGFKHLEDGMQCQGFIFKEGETYLQDGEVVMCESGFHFCRMLHQVPLWKNVFYGSTHFVEARGVLDDPDKAACSEIRIGRALTFQEWLYYANDGKSNLGWGNRGDFNRGDSNRGRSNRGDFNLGDFNLGDFNLGDFNRGHYNQGNSNRGHYNQGHHNQGTSNRGDFNRGHYKSRRLQ